VNRGIFGFPQAGNVVEQFFDAPGTYAWTRPAGATAIYYEICGSGGGGSGGQLGVVSTANRFGATGGSAGEFISGYLYGSQIPSGGQIVVPAGGSGGSSSAAQNSSGQSHGIAGSSASFCGVLFAAGGATGSAAGGFNWTGDGAAQTLGNPHAGRRSGAGSLGADGVAAPGSGIYPGGGGGGGGSNFGTTTVRAGGAGGQGFSRRKGAPTALNQTATGPAGATTGGVAAVSAAYGSGDGGGGGSYTGGSSGAWTHGGNGGWPGGGGGGGAGADTNAAAGTSIGGNGGGGMVRLWILMQP
jgi:hypothetical protein